LESGHGIGERLGAHQPLTVGGDTHEIGLAEAEISQGAFVRHMGVVAEVDPHMRRALQTVAGQRDHELAIEVFGAPVVKRFRYEPPAPALARLVLEVELEVDAYIPEKAFADADKLDLTKPFYPLGQAPRPGSTFYFAAPEALSKPGAHLTVHLDGTDTPQDRLSGSNATALAHNDPSNAEPSS